MRLLRHVLKGLCRFVGFQHGMVLAGGNDLKVRSAYLMASVVAKKCIYSPVTPSRRSNTLWTSTLVKPASPRMVNLFWPLLPRAVLTHSTSPSDHLLTSSKAEFKHSRLRLQMLRSHGYAGDKSFTEVSDVWMREEWLQCRSFGTPAETGWKDTYPTFSLTKWPGIRLPRIPNIWATTPEPWSTRENKTCGTLTEVLGKSPKTAYELRPSRYPFHRLCITPGVINIHDILGQRLSWHRPLLFFGR